MASISRFRRRAIEIGRGIELNAKLIVEDVAVAVTGVLANVTPRDTGLARSNWVASVGDSPDLSPRAIRSPGDVVSEVRGRVSRVGADATVTIANGGNKVPYLQFLNAGSSQQAPAGFVQNAAAVGAAVASEARILRPRNPRGRRII